MFRSKKKMAVLTGKLDGISKSIATHLADILDAAARQAARICMALEVTRPMRPEYLLVRSRDFTGTGPASRNRNQTVIR
jgi:hypothetical protein